MLSNCQNFKFAKNDHILTSNQNATLPARVNGNGAAPAPRGAVLGGPSRHFRPFDHRRMNPMEDIHENPYAVFKVR